MKERYREWLKLTASEQPSAANRNNGPIVMRNHPTVRRLEQQLLLRTDVRGRPAPGIEDHASKELFGITRSDTIRPSPPTHAFMTVKEDREYENWLAYEDQFETEDATDDEIVEILLPLGLDFRDDKGWPLRCVKLLSRQAEAAARRICGRLPDRTTADLDQFASSMQRDVEKFLARKRGQTT